MKILLLFISLILLLFFFACNDGGGKGKEVVTFYDTSKAHMDEDTMKIKDSVNIKIKTQ